MTAQALYPCEYRVQKYAACVSAACTLLHIIKRDTVFVNGDFIEVRPGGAVTTLWGPWHPPSPILLCACGRVTQHILFLYSFLVVVDRSLEFESAIHRLSQL